MNDRPKATHWRAPDEPCLNCGDPTPGRYCPSCGQRKMETRVSVRTMVADVLEDQLAVNRALPRTVVSLLFRPGHLTNEYIRGRIVSYIAPFRLYLVASILFFLILSFLGLAALEIETDADGGAAADSALVEGREALLEQQQAIAGVDTTEMPEEARAALRASLAGIEARLAAADSAAARLADAQDTTAADTADTAAGGDTAVTDAAVASDTAATDAEPDDEVQGGLQPWARNFRTDISNPLIQEAVERKVAEVGHLPGREALQVVLRDYVEFAPHMVFLLLPVFALMLKLLYIRRKRYYAEHFVFALHVHAFTFVTFTLMLLLPWSWADAVLFFWMVLYVWIAMRRVYQQGFIRTTLKWWVLGWSYVWVLTFGMIGLGIVTLLLT